MTTVITLAQAPSALEDVGRRLVVWRHHVVLGRDPAISVDATDPNRRISLLITTETNEGEVVHAISPALSKPERAKPFQGTSFPPREK